MIWEGRTAGDWASEWRRVAGVNLPAPLIHERVESTNDVARRLAEAGAVTGTSVIADEQTKGRGRAGRPWHAPAGTALLFSLVIRAPGTLAADDAPGAIPLRIGLAVARAVDRTAGTRLHVKWPNDLQLAGAKIAGILCEASLATQQGGYVVVGIGLNVNQKAEQLPEAAWPATSLLLTTGRPWNRGELAGSIITEVVATAERLTAPLSAAELAELDARDPLRGRLLTVDGEVAGVAEGFAPDGALLIRGPNNKTTNLRHGTIRLAVPNGRTTTE